MALHKNFDPSKQFRVTKTFFEGGRKFVEGDTYAPQTKIGKSKALFRHFVAGRIEQVQETQTVSEDVQAQTSESKTEEKPTTTPKRGRKKKSTSSTKQTPSESSEGDSTD